MTGPVRPAVIDCHVHVGASVHWLPEGLELARATTDRAGREALEPDGPTGSSIAGYLRDNGVVGAVGIPCGGAAVQEYTIDEAAATDGLIRPLVQYEPRSVPDASRRFRAAIERGAVGLKVHPATHQLPPNDRALYPLYEVAAEVRVPVMIHVGSSVFPGAKMRYCDPMLVDEVAADFPELQLICAHAGRGFWTDQVFFLTRMRENVWMELSGLPPRRLPEYFPELDKVADRILWGSDWPSSPAIGDLTTQVQGLPYARSTIEKLLWRNAAAMFGFDDLDETS